MFNSNTSYQSIETNDKKPQYFNGVQTIGNYNWWEFVRHEYCPEAGGTWFSH